MDKQISAGLGEAEAEPHILDLAHLARCSQGDRALECELLTLYMDQAREQMRLVNAVREEETFRMALHTLKGTALAVGVRSVAAAAARLEELGFEGVSETRTAMLETLESDVAAAESCIRRYLAREDRSGISAQP
jgi:HPt (histidine-containing phosphotransfer) domain-containing protein